MKTYIALLRGINVGKSKRVAMAELRDLLTDLGHSDVATLLNSGNAVFRTRRGAPATLAAEIAAALHSRLNVAAPVIVKSARDLAEIVARNPLHGSALDPSRVMVVFVQDRVALSALAEIAPLAVAPEQFVIGKYAAYAHCPAGVLASAIGKALLGKPGTSATTRNWATVLKLRALAG